MLRKKIAKGKVTKRHTYLFFNVYFEWTDTFVDFARLTWTPVLIDRQHRNLQFFFTSETGSEFK